MYWRTKRFFARFGRKVEGVVAELGFGSQHMSAWADLAVKIGVDRCFADYLVIEGYGFFQNRTQRGVAENVQPSFVLWRSREGLEGFILLGGFHWNRSTAREQCDAECSSTDQ